MNAYIHPFVPQTFPEHLGRHKGKEQWTKQKCLCPHGPQIRVGEGIKWIENMKNVKGLLVESSSFFNIFNAKGRNCFFNLSLTMMNRMWCLELPSLPFFFFFKAELTRRFITTLVTDDIKQKCEYMHFLVLWPCGKKKIVEWSGTDN